MQNNNPTQLWGVGDKIRAFILIAIVAGAVLHFVFDIQWEGILTGIGSMLPMVIILIATIAAITTATTMAYSNKF